MEAIVVVGLVFFIGLVVSALREKPPTPKGVPKAPDRGRTSNVQPQSLPKRRNHRTADRQLDFNDVRGTNEFDDDGLATFTISLGQQEEESQNKSPGRWVSPGEKLEVNGHSITGGKFYFGGKLSAANQFGSEASLIDETLDVAQATRSETDDSLRYWPKYNGLSAKCRGAYLNWLSSNREDPDVPIGYVFLYFYGLERRVIVDSVESDQVDDAEFHALAQEIRRLLAIYGKNPAFKNYACRLLEWMVLLRPQQVSISDEEVAQHNLRLLFSIRAGELVLAGHPIPAKTAYTWLNFTDFVPKTPARRCQEEFQKLFCKLYSAQYGDGIKIKPNKTLVKPSYHPASGSLNSTSLGESRVPDPIVLKSVANKLINLANQASDKLDSYSRYLGRDGKDRNNVEAVLLLPEEIADVSSSPTLSAFSEWANQIIKETDGLTTLQAFWSQLSETTIEKVNKNEIAFLQKVLDKTGFGMAPDPRFHHAKPSPTGNVVLFASGHKGLDKPSNNFNEIGMALRLGAMMAKIDGYVHKEEVDVLQNLIYKNKELSEQGKASLQAYLIWRLNSSQDTASLKKQIENLGTEAKKGISKILVSVAIADGKISADQIKEMEKLYSSLGLDKALVASDIHGLTTAKSPEVSDTVSTPQSSSATSNQLNENILDIHESETEHVQNILSSIFTEPEDDASVIDEENTIEERQDDDDLDPEHRKLFEQLITQEMWTHEEVESMCARLGLMFDGAIETINDWSFELLDEPVLDDDGDLYVMLDIAEGIASGKGKLADE